MSRLASALVFVVSLPLIIRDNVRRLFPKGMHCPVTGCPKVKLTPWTARRHYRKHQASLPFLQHRSDT